MQVRVVFGRWQDVAGQLEKYDGIFFDTYSEHYLHMRAFHDLLPQILKKDGIYSFFNGLAPRCPFFSRCDGHLDPVKQWLFLVMTTSMYVHCCQPSRLCIVNLTM
jgi:hypothetical protein